jgi:hypothetical protein
MNVQLNHIIIRQRSAELHRADGQARLASEGRTGRSKSRHPTPTTRSSLQHGRVGPRVVPGLNAERGTR